MSVEPRGQPVSGLAAATYLPRIIPSGPLYIHTVGSIIKPLINTLNTLTGMPLAPSFSTSSLLLLRTLLQPIMRIFIQKFSHRVAPLKGTGTQN